MSDIDPEGFYRHPDPLCVCGPLYTYGGHIEPGGYAEDCPIHGNPKVFYDEVGRLRAGIEALARDSRNHYEMHGAAGDDYVVEDGRCVDVDDLHACSTRPKETTMTDQTTDAERLRDAATRLREVAADATPGPWEVCNFNEGSQQPLWGVANDAFHNPPGDEDALWLAVEVHTGVEPDATHIAMMHPPVALALADWLTKEATFSEAFTPREALAVADAVLSPTGGETDE